jgi:uncharacterized membrane protein YdbT with pleckstrin-like domain
MQQTPIIKPSQWINIGYILFGIVASPLVFPFLIMLYKMLDVYYWRYEFYENHVIEKRGVFSVTRTELYYHRIKGIQHHAPFLYRIVGISQIQIVSSDPFASFFQFMAIPKGLELSQAIRDKSLSGRKRMKLKELDFYQL